MIRSNALRERIEKEYNYIQNNLPLTTEVKLILDKKFRLEFNYNSNHIEGNTLTYSETELLLIFDKTDGGHEFREYQEMQAHDVALVMIQEEATDISRPLTEQFIKNINECLLVKPFWKEAITETGAPTKKKIIPGQYKTTHNSVLQKNGEIFYYAPPDEVPHKINELVKWFNESKSSIDPLTLASTFHHDFVLIHPFDDGNGRTARLLMNYILLLFNYPLVVIKTAEKQDYLTALNYADSGKLDYFIDYIGNQLLWSLGITIKAIDGEDVEEEEDLDKELKMLTSSLMSIPNEFEDAISPKATSLVLTKSILPLFKSLYEKLNLLKDLFVSVEIFLDTSERDNTTRQSQDYHTNAEETLELLDKIGYENLDLIEDAIITIACSTLKKVTELVNIRKRLKIDFSEYHFTFIDLVTSEILCKLPYGRILTKAQNEKIVKHIMYSIISDIKLATGKG